MQTVVEKDTCSIQPASSASQGNVEVSLVEDLAFSPEELSFGWRPFVYRWRSLVLGTLFVVVSVVFLSVVFLNWFVDPTLSERLIACRVHSFVEDIGRFPDPENDVEMESLGFELGMGWRPELDTRRQHEFELVFFAGFEGPNLRYDSATRTWFEK
ncbi:MAG: hypothetical protein GY822_04205 [Deltaproteobacteria bacterium]|nr:hypothetical protein [Deltaproteobacteria bacterium]